MNCSQCGKPIPDNSVFCPFCGIPQKVTADYDYIQGEIGANVDKIKTEGKTDRRPEDPQRQRPGSGRSSDPNRTKDIYGEDTVFGDSGNNGHYQNARDGHDDGYYDDYDDEYYDDYDDEYYDDYDYEDWGIEGGSGNKGTIITTIIIAIICLAGIAAIIYFGLRPQDKNNVVDVLKAFNQNNVEINEGDEYSGEVVLSLVSEQGYDIRYTTDGSDVKADSTLYTTPITANQEGTFQFKAMSYNENGEPSGEGISHAIIIVEPETTKETEAETEAEADTETVFTMEEAEDIVENALRDEGAINEDGHTEDGGYINLIYSGDTVLEGTTYYIVQTDYYDAAGTIWETTFYGVNTQTGDLVFLDKTEDGYSLLN